MFTVFTGYSTFFIYFCGVCTAGDGGAKCMGEIVGVGLKELE